MKYKAGYMVKIVSERTGAMNGNGEMDFCLGQIMTIKEVWDGDHYTMEEDNGIWYYDDEMIESLEKEKV